MPDRFKEINSDDAMMSAVKATIVLKRYEKGNAFARAMLAGLGQIHIDGDLLLEDPEKKELLAKYEIKKTFAWGGIYGGTTTIEDVEVGFAESVASIILGEEDKKN